MGSTLTLSTDYSTPVSAAADTVTAGTAVCELLDGTGYATATTANLALAGGKFAGIAISSGGPRSPIGVVVVGPVPAQVVGVLSGSGDYVDVTATGSLIRSTGITTSTIGAYLPSGNVLVDLNLQFGSAFTGNATSLQSSPISAAAVTPRGSILATDGTYWRQKSWEPDLRDYFRDYGGDEAGGDCMPALVAMLTACKNGRAFIKKSTSSSYFALKTQGRLYDQTSTGNLNHVHLIGPDGRHMTGVAPTFKCSIPQVKGVGASITAYTNGSPGSGQYTMTVDLGAASGVTAALVSYFRGKWLRLWPNSSGTAVTTPNTGEFIIVDVPSDNIVKVSNQNTGAATDAFTYNWRVLQPVLDIRMRDFILEGCSFWPDVNGRVDAYIEQNFAPGTGAQQVIRNTIRNCTFDTSSRFRDVVDSCIWVARSVVAESGNFLYTSQAPTGLNGAGDLQEKYPYQVDTMNFEDCLFNGARRFGIGFYSRTGQTKECRVTSCGFSFCGVGIGCQLTRWGGAAWSPDGGPHFDIRDSDFAACDVFIRHGGTSSGRMLVENCYSEQYGCIYEDYHALAAFPAEFNHNAWTFSGTTEHPSRELMRLNGAGPYNFRGGIFDLNTGMASRIVARGDSTSAQPVYNFFGVQIKGAPGFTARRGRRTSTKPGPIPIAGTEVITFVFDSGTESVTLSQANFNTTFGTGAITIPSTEVTYRQIADVCNRFLTKGKCWADPEDTTFYAESNTMGIGSTLQITVAPAAMGLVGGPSAGVAATALLTESQGLLEVSHGSGALTKCRANNIGSLMTNAATGVEQPFLTSPFRTYSATLQVINRSGFVDITGANNTAAVTFPTAEVDANYKFASLVCDVIAGAPAAGSTRAFTTLRANTGFTINLGDVGALVAPGVGNTVRVFWVIER